MLRQVVTIVWMRFLADEGRGVNLMTHFLAKVKELHRCL